MQRFVDIQITGTGNGGAIIDWPGDSGLIDVYAADFNGQTIKLQRRRNADDAWRDVADAVLSATTLEVGFTAGVCQLQLVGTGVTSVDLRVSRLGVGYRVDVPR